MKSYKLFAAILSLMLLFSVNVIAQEDEMTTEEWQNEMNRLTEKKAAFLSNNFYFLITCSELQWAARLSLFT